MTEYALKRIQLIFQTEIKILKYTCPGLSHFSLKALRPLLRESSSAPNCLYGLEKLDFMRVGELPRSGNNNVRLIYLCILIMAYEDSSMRLLKRIKNLAYDESQPLTYIGRQFVPEEFRSYYDDMLFRKLFVEFFHLVASRQSANKVIKFIEYHPILDFAFTLLFKRMFLGQNVSSTTFLENVQTADLIIGIFSKLELKPQIIDRRLRIGEYRYLAQDEQNTYMTYHRQDDLDLDFTHEQLSSSDSEEESNTISTTLKMSSMKESHCDSSKTKVTQESDPSKWVTPIKDQAPYITTTTARESVHVPKITQYFKCDDIIHNGNSYRGSAYLQEYELKYGEIKDKLRKLESDVQNYNNPAKLKTSHEQSVEKTTTKIFPLCFKDRQSERRMSNQSFETSFFREKEKPITSNGIAITNRSGNPSVSMFMKTCEFPPKPPRIEPKSSRDLFSQSTQSPLIRITSNVQKQTESHNRNHSRTSSQVETKSMIGTTTLLKQNPKKIMVRKI